MQISDTDISKSFSGSNILFGRNFFKGCQNESGKNRVSGKVVAAKLRTFDALRGQWLYKSQLYALVKHQRKKFGKFRNTKSTSIKMEGEMIVTVFGQNSNTYLFEANTGGNNLYNVIYSFVNTGWQTSPTVSFEFSGYVNFFGRAGSNCSI